MTPTDLRALLRDCLDVIAPLAEDSGYGFFPGGDPRRFTPDPECSTEAERAAHKAACAAWDRGETTAGQEARPYWVGGEDGKAVAHVTPSGFGLGVYVHTDATLDALAKRIAAALETP